jgi:hypothetical protein
MATVPKLAAAIPSTLSAMTIGSLTAMCALRFPATPRSVPSAYPPVISPAMIHPASGEK